jgi:cell pole-organizing protein PopZ
MAEDTDSAAEPSMEEILASIRKIISDETPPAAEPVAAKATVAPQEDVLELTQMVQDDGSILDVSAPKEQEAPLPPPSPAPAPRVSAAPLPPASESLVSAPTASSAASALSSLANTVEIERLSSAPNTATFIGNGSRTLEDMVVELMRPLLKDWLDKNLPAVVERLVQKEIEHIARRS